MTSTPTTPPPGGDFTLGELLDGRYRLESLLGRGGMATVYQARDEALDRAVAIKVFPPGVATEDDDRRRAEVRVLARLSHPALVTLFDAVEDGASGRAYFVMELVEGPDLRQRLLSGPVTPAETARIGADVATALAYIHSNGIVHRDVKPGNILLPKPGPHSTHAAQLADFGIARILDATRVTSADAVLGTVAYLSPEQAAGSAVNAATDVYSLGLVLIECLTGERVFPGSAIEATAARLSRDPVVPDAFGSDWETLLLGMTARDPNARSSAAQVAPRLRVLATESAVPATVSTAPTTVQDAPTLLLPAATATERLVAPRRTPVARPARRRVRLPLLIAGGLVAAAIVAGIVLLGAAQGNEPLGQAPPSATPGARGSAVVTHEEINYPSVKGGLGKHLEQLEQSVDVSNDWPDYTAADARPLQAGVLSVAQAAAGDDFATALDAADTLSDRVAAALDEGAITREHSDEILASLSRVRDDLEQADKHDKPGKPGKDD